MKKFIAICAAVAFLSACSSPAVEDAASVADPAAVVTTEAPVSWNGTWKAEGFSAVIKDNLIIINMVSPDSSSLYWQGTWDSSKKAKDGAQIVSIADVEALSMSMLGSQSETKAFAFSDDELKFSMSLMGTTKTVRLKK